MMALPDPLEFISSLPIGDYRPTYIEIPFPTCTTCGQPRHSPLFDDDGNVHWMCDEGHDSDDIAAGQCGVSE